MVVVGTHGGHFVTSLHDWIEPQSLYIIYVGTLSDEIKRTMKGCIGFRAVGVNLMHTVMVVQKVYCRNILLPK